MKGRPLAPRSVGSTTASPTSTPVRSPGRCRLTTLLLASAFGDPTERDGWLTNPNADPAAALRLETTGSHNLNGKYNGILSPTWLLEISAGRHWSRSGLEAATDEGRSVPRQIDETIGQYERGGFQRLQDDTASRGAFAAKLTNVFNTHELRYGFDVEVNKYDADLNETWFRFFGPSAGVLRRTSRSGSTPSSVRAVRSNAAWYAQDAWRPLSNVQLNLGLRYELQTLSSANDVAIGGESDAEACTAHGECRTVDSLTLTNNWAPRLGVSWDPSNNGRSKVYAFWGRFYEAIPLDMNIRAINGERYVIPQHVSNVPLNSNNWFNPNGSPLARNGPWTVRSTTRLTALTPLDEDLKSQYQDQFIVGGEYQIGAVWSVGARYIDRQLRRIIEDIGTFTDPEDPLALTGYVIGNPGEGFFGAPFDKPSRSYRALELTMQKAFANRWHLNSSFVYARAQRQPRGPLHERLRSARSEHHRSLRHPVVPAQFRRAAARRQAISLQAVRSVCLRLGVDDFRSRSSCRPASRSRRRAPKSSTATATARSSCCHEVRRGAPRHSATSTSTPTTGCRWATRATSA